MVYCAKLETKPYNRECFLIIADTCKEGSKYIDETFTDHYYKDKLYKEKIENTECGYEVRCRIRKNGRETARFFIVIDKTQISQTRCS